MTINKKTSGFTLVELLIVIAIIGILAAALLPKLTGGQARARDMSRTAALTQLSNGVEMFFIDEGMLPLRDSDNDEVGSCATALLAIATNGHSVQNYIGGTIPEDVTGRAVTMCTGDAGSFGYVTDSDTMASATMYVLTANVELEDTDNTTTVARTDYAGAALAADDADGAAVEEFAIRKSVSGF